VWCDVLAPTSAEIIASFTQDYYANRAAITANDYGQGKAIYVGTIGNDALYTRLAGWLLALINVHPPLDIPPGVEVTERWRENKRLLFVLNHSAQDQHITLDGSYTDLINGATFTGTLAIAPSDVLILDAGE
jgi:beta-galactosidase